MSGDVGAEVAAIHLGLVRGPLREQDIDFGDPRLPTRFWAKVRVTEAGCWEWIGLIKDNGYGRFYIDNRSPLAHRFSYETIVGELPEGKPYLDHLCRNRKCARPSHLEAVTPSENARRGLSPYLSRNKDMCRNGLHPWPENARQKGTRQRYCIECNKAAQKRWRQGRQKRRQEQREAS